MTRIRPNNLSVLWDFIVVLYNLKFQYSIYSWHYLSTIVKDYPSKLQVLRYFANRTIDPNTSCNCAQKELHMCQCLRDSTSCFSRTLEHLFNINLSDGPGVWGSIYMLTMKGKL